MKRIYATFGGSKMVENKSKEGISYPSTVKLIWKNVCDDTGEVLDGEFLSNKTQKLTKFQLRSGNRYVIECAEITDKNIVRPTSIVHTYKNPQCNIIRFFRGDYKFIKGKYNGKFARDIDKVELTKYLVWLGQNTKNEATVKNVLKILEKING